MKNIRLPYIDNAKAVIATLAVNTGVVFLFQWPDGITYRGLVWDSLICVLVTVTIDMWMVYGNLKKMRSAGKMPAQVPVSRFMQKLPQNPAALGALYFLGFGAMTVGGNMLITKFFGIQDMAFVPWMTYKLIYSTALSITVVNYCIFRYVQPDWAAGGTGTQPVRNPIPKIGLFKEIYGSVTGNIAMNIIIGSLLGGAVLAPDGSVILRPTTIQGIPITGLVFGLIVGILVTGGVVKVLNKGILATDPVLLKEAAGNKWFSWMPMRRGSLTCFVCVCVMVFSAAALPAVMMLFGMSAMNFYQFTIFITLYATVISKPLSYVLTRRCMQPDYIGYILHKAGIRE